MSIFGIQICLDTNTKLLIPKDKLSIGAKQWTNNEKETDKNMSIQSDGQRNSYKYGQTYKIDKVHNVTQKQFFLSIRSHLDKSISFKKELNEWRTYMFIEELCS